MLRRCLCILTGLVLMLPAYFLIGDFILVFPATIGLIAGLFLIAYGINRKWFKSQD